MSRSYRDDYSEHSVRAFNAQKQNNKTTKSHFEIVDEDGLVCPNCHKFCTYTYLAKNTHCYNCKHEISLDE